MNEIASRSPGDIIESVIIKGDLAKLSAQERADYYAAVCRSVGLNPLTQPLSYITLNGKLTLYATRGATDQLRRIYKVSVESLVPDMRNDVYFVTCKVKDGEGRTDIATGAVTLGNLKGDALANQLMKAETKAKRRATLSIVGLGLLDESELETIPAAARQPVAAPIEIAAPPERLSKDPPDHDPVTGETGPRVIIAPTKGNHYDWIGFGQRLIAGIQTAVNAEELKRWIDLNNDMLAPMAQHAPRAHGSVVKAVAVMEEKLGAPIAEPADTPRLAAKESAQLLKALVRRLAECQTIDQIHEWRQASEEGIASLQDEDQAQLMDWIDTRFEQLTEVAQTVGA